MWTFMTPELAVEDLAATQAWYRDVLGCEIAFERGDYGGVKLGTTELFLREVSAPTAPVVCCVRVEDADGLFALYVERGADIVEPIGDRPWGMREFTLRDPNGHRFRIGHPTRR